eukprot:3157266-Rhodomonas_salina.2
MEHSVPTVECSSTDGAAPCVVQIGQHSGLPVECVGTDRSALSTKKRVGGTDGAVLRGEDQLHPLPPRPRLSWH